MAFYESMMKEVVKNYSGLKKWKNKEGGDTPILIISGDDDPVGEKGKGVYRLGKKYYKAGLNVSMKLYEGARHELLNEVNKAEVVKDIINFIQK